MITRFPFYSDTVSRDLFFLELGSDKFVKRGETFKHFVALKVSLWYDIEAIMQDAGKIFLHELNLAGVLSDEWSGLLTADVLADSRCLKAEIQKAIAVGVAKSDAALTGKTHKRVRYSVPRGQKLNSLYLLILQDVLATLKIKHHDTSIALRAMADQIED